MTGEIVVECQINGSDGFIIEVFDDGVGFPEGFDPHTSHSFGIRLMRSLAVQIGAKAIWLQQGIVSPEARLIATEAGLDYVENLCTAVIRAIERLTNGVRVGGASHLVSQRYIGAHSTQSGGSAACRVEIRFWRYQQHVHQ